MVQGGDPTGTGRGGTSIYGQKFEDEITPELRFVGAGILAMGAFSFPASVQISYVVHVANSGPNTNGNAFGPPNLRHLTQFVLRLSVFPNASPNALP